MPDATSPTDKPILRLKKKRIIINPKAKKTGKPVTTKTQEAIKKKAPPPAPPKKKAPPPPTPPKKKKVQHQTTPEEAEQGRAKLSAYLNETSAVWRDFKPLAVGIRQASKPLMKELKLPRKRLAELLDRHCKAPEYLKNLVESSDNQRYRLNGTPEGAVTPEQKERARKQLKRANRTPRQGSE